MNREEISSILCELHKISGLRVSLHGKDFREIAAYPQEVLPLCAAIQASEAEYEKCLECDERACLKVQQSGETYIYKCRYGLTEAICPLYNFGTLTGYLMMGQVADENLNTSYLEAVLISNGAGQSDAKKAVGTLTKINSDLLASYVKIMTICAEYMTLTNALPSHAPRIPELAKMYMHENFSRKVTIKDICKSLGCSKSALLASFKAEYGTTVNAYLCEVRIAEAKKLLCATQRSISEIAEEVGFYDQSYFTKVFVQKCGRTPSDYRKDNSR